MQFSGIIHIRGSNPYVLVSKETAQALQQDWRKPMPVIIQVNGQPKEPWHINMMPTGDGSFYLYLHAAVRKASQTKVGDIIEVSIEFDKSYHNGPQHPIPLLFQSALDQDPLVRSNWEKLPPSRQKEILRYFSFLKSDAALKKNIEKAIRIIRGERGRFMARDWNENDAATKN